MGQCLGFPQQADKRRALSHQVVFSLEKRMPGTLPTRLTTILSRLLPVSTLTALLMVMLSRLIPLTSTSLSPTSRPASSVNTARSKNPRDAAEWDRKMESTCCAVVLHLADEDAEAVLGAPAHAEAQLAVQTFVHCDGVEVLAVIATWEHVT